ncbi:deoxyhypusine synthase [Candidatus Pacearchaeota archaeon]|nr:deoxyhypusine synthase [Candidatus Pacearchaeota archaeon]
MQPVKPVKIKKDMKVSELVDALKETGFNARKLGEASEILVEMIKDKECKIFLGLAGAMVPAGMKSIILDLLDYTYIFVSTGANLTHDLIEALGHKHYKGDEKANDEELHKQGIDRIYDIFMKQDVYKDLEKFFEKHWQQLEKCTNIKELLWKIGKLVDNDCILKKCFEKKIPIFCPAIADSGIGLMIWSKKAAGKKIIIDAFEDMKEIIDFAWQAKKKGVIYIGGGVPKNFIQQSMQFSTPASYGIQISTDKEEYGGSSGAKLKEGISWGKMSEKGKFISIISDATIILPLLVASAFDKI